MTHNHADGSVTSDCPHCLWGSGKRNTATEATDAAREHLSECEARAAYWAGTRTEVRA